ncbi:reverse transcriptase [Phytophthora megakarya]|uniref:Reverse transcriptase n=1 Tax=Phytophthora megakarya TaxID=4795 RepID=A0A225W2A3_9STRA|nr:reverse transcriptase [Phytophthora megakarya]
MSRARLHVAQSHRRSAITLHDFFPKIPTESKATDIENQFRAVKKQAAKRRKQEERATPAAQSNHPSLHEADQTFGCVTQNVNGFGSSAVKMGEWLRSFRTSDRRGRNDVYILQETHVEEREISRASATFAGQWGFRTGPGCPFRSFWSPSCERKGGVAILVDPYGSFTDVGPVYEHMWSPHFMAVKGMMKGEKLIVVNIYAPHQPAKREAFYRKLTDMDIPTGVKMAIGGDFNCTLDPVADRSYFRQRDGHDSPALRMLLENWGLADPVAWTRPLEWTPVALRQHHDATHTYFYRVDGHGSATSRLDRWYITPSLRTWVAQTEVVHPATKADHAGVKLHLRSPSDPVRVWKPARIHPVPGFAEIKVAEATRERLAQFLDEIPSEVVAAGIAWDSLKIDIAKHTRRIVKECRKRRRHSLQKKLYRMARQDERLKELRDGHRPSVDLITDLMDGLSLADVDGDSPRMRLRRAITECKRERASLSQRRLLASATHWDGKTTKQFFRRISSKFADNTIPRLRPAEGCPARGIHDKADTLADAWSPIFQQPARESALAVNVANIFCLKKGGDSGDPLNYRPLALLNSDYKIFTRILATRVSALLPMQIHPNQNGFVARRTIHDTIDLFDAAQIAATRDIDQDEAIYYDITGTQTDLSKR